MKKLLFLFLVLLMSGCSLKDKIRRNEEFYLATEANLRLQEKYTQALVAYRNLKDEFRREVKRKNDFIQRIRKVEDHHSMEMKQIFSQGDSR